MYVASISVYFSFFGEACLPPTGPRHCSPISGGVVLIWRGWKVNLPSTGRDRTPAAVFPTQLLVSPLTRGAALLPCPAFAVAIAAAAANASFDQPMVHSMKVGSVSVDLAAATGGNIATTRADEVRSDKKIKTLTAVCVIRSTNKQHRSTTDRSLAFSSYFSVLWVVGWFFSECCTNVSCLSCVPPVK